MPFLHMPENLAMRTPLDDLLCHRYPALYAERHGNVRATSMCWGFCHGDGWFAIIDALSEVLTSAAEMDNRPVPPTRQVKEKLGTLRYYRKNSTEVDRGAVDMACEMSARLCEQTGRPGRRTLGACGCVIRVACVDEGAEIYGSWWDRCSGMGVPPVRFNLAEMKDWRADVLDGPVEVPDGRLDLVDGMLRELGIYNRDLIEDLARRAVGGPNPRDTFDAPVRVTLVWETTEGLRVDYSGGGRRCEGIVSMALALSRRMDRMTGAAGPVNDDGILICADRP